MNLELRGVLEKEGVIMKKIYKILLLLLFFVPAVVFADVAGPDPRPYDVEVKKSEIDYYDYNGIKYGEKLGTLKKGETLTVYNQIEIEDVVWLGCEYGKKYIYVRATDVVAKGELDVKDRTVFAEGEPVRVKITDEIILRKGPSPAYEESGRLEDVITEYTYYVAEGYIYLSYKGQKGWVSNDEVLYDGGNYIAAMKVGDGGCLSIPANTVIKDVWKKSPYGGMLEVDYNGCSGEISLGNLSNLFVRLPETQRKYKLKEDVGFYPVYGEDEYKTIDEGEEIIVYSADPEYSRHTPLYYVEYNGKMGWIEAELDDIGEYVGSVKKVLKDIKEDDDEEEKKELDSETIVIICIVIGLAVAIGAFGVILYLYNKGKKEEKNEKNA